MLGNHGLIVAGQSVAEAEALLMRVVAALSASPAPCGAPDIGALAALGGANYAPPEAGHPLHGVALSPARCAAATAGSLYPDHVIFCGPGASALEDGDVGDAFVARCRARGLEPPPFLLACGRGALLRVDAGAGARALARCLGDVLARVAEGTALNYLTREQTLELLDWDAEKYRQAMNAR